ncbi:hypothetical protein PCC6912_42320 [Chlorogloeopsis fritschii PCC 6912]|uniref:Uncharacterized protein n=1 Tax=Chlorogloeopsis fritschii PCC 6912 TaxID=211165 RepID=A0A433N4Z0_CHLFR|nr:hypothetical protein PCC6912_42320 [Chlorogloeopsis fritschii PCC 6912]
MQAILSYISYSIRTYYGVEHDKSNKTVLNDTECPVSEWEISRVDLGSKYDVAIFNVFHN